MDLQSAGTHVGSGFISGLLVALGYKKYVESKLQEHEKSIHEAKVDADAHLRAFRSEVATSFKTFQETTTKAIDEIKSAANRMSDKVVWQDACENCKKTSDVQDSATIRALASMDTKIDTLIKKIKA